MVEGGTNPRRLSSDLHMQPWHIYALTQRENYRQAADTDTENTHTHIYTESHSETHTDTDTGTHT